MANASRYKTAADALIVLENKYDGWSKRLTDTSLQLAFALIAANWAVFGNEKILSQVLPRLSIACAFLTILTVLITAKLMVSEHDTQHERAEKDSKRWEEEWLASQSSSTPWPYTSKIECIGEISRFFRFWLPILGCVFLGFSFI